MFSNSTCSRRPPHTRGQTSRGIRRSIRRAYQPRATHLRAGLSSPLHLSVHELIFRDELLFCVAFAPLLLELIPFDVAPVGTLPPLRATPSLDQHEEREKREAELHWGRAPRRVARGWSVSTLLEQVSGNTEAG